MNENRRLRPWLALLLSLLTPGLGHFYSNELLRALLYGLALPLLLATAGVFLLQSFTGLVVIASTSLVLGLAIHVDAFRLARYKRQAPMSLLNRWPTYVVILLFMLIAARPLVRLVLPFRAYSIPSPAMEPTLMIGDRIMASNGGVGSGAVGPGDLVVFRSPGDPREDYIKRVVATGGDNVEIRSKQLIVNNVPNAEPYAIHSDRRVVERRDNFGPIVVPNHHVFVLGDNRDNSADSRFFGPISESEIRGRALYIYFGRSMDRLGRRLDTKSATED